MAQKAIIATIDNVILAGKTATIPPMSELIPKRKLPDSDDAVPAIFG